MKPGEYVSIYYTAKNSAYCRVGKVLRINKKTATIEFADEVQRVPLARIISVEEVTGE